MVRCPDFRGAVYTNRVFVLAKFVLFIELSSFWCALYKAFHYPIQM